jgi:hypothetical protein
LALPPAIHHHPHARGIMVKNLGSSREQPGGEKMILDKVVNKADKLTINILYFSMLDERLYHYEYRKPRLSNRT